jgi:glycosyltransferase involved in cell wall biosynthesis
MKIAWYTPFSAQSAVGRFSLLVVQALRGEGVHVQIVRSESRASALRGNAASCPDEKYVWAADWHRHVEQHLNEYDLVVYNVGDHYDNHLYCFQHQNVVPGLTILHDYCLHHALYHHCLRAASITGQYRDQLLAESGQAAAQVYDRLLHTGSSQLWWHHELGRFPVYRWALRNTLGVVTHARFYQEDVAARIGCPVDTIPLAYDCPIAPASPAPRDPTNKLTILTVGAVNANKRYEAVIRALAESSVLRSRCRFRIVGPADSAQRQMISLSVQAHAHRPDVTMTGQVTRAELQREVQAADIISCLRYPALEGASASVVEGLLSGKPVVVCATGCYDEIPEDVVFKVSPQHEHSQLTRTLEQIVADYPASARRGQAAQQWAASRHAPRAYASQFLSFAQQVLYDQPVLRLVDRIADQFQSWNAVADPCLLRRVDRAMSDLFGRRTEAERAA